MQRQVQAGCWVASTLSLALSCASCLVTNELDFTPARSQLTVQTDSPVTPFPVPTVGSDECDDPLTQLSFRARYYFEDAEQPLTVLPLVNGNTIGLFSTYVAEPNPDGSPEHVPPTICVPLERLSQPCNVVELFVSDDPDLLRNDVNRLRDEPRIVRATWLVFGTSTETMGSSAQPYVGFYECLPGGGM